MIVALCGLYTQIIKLRSLLYKMLFLQQLYIVGMKRAEKVDV